MYDVPQQAPQELTPEQAAKFAEVAKRLEAEGAVLVQTEESVGTEDQPITVH